MPELGNNDIIEKKTLKSIASGQNCFKYDCPTFKFLFFGQNVSDSKVDWSDSNQIWPRDKF